LAPVGCGAPAPIRVPHDPNEAWSLVPPESVGMDSHALALGLASLPAPAEHGLASMLVLRHGQPVLEQYWNGYDADTLHDLRSATKSLTSLLVGIALDQKILSGVDEPIRTRLAPLYPGAPVLERGLLLEDLLTMRSGLACDDWDSSSPGNEQNMYQSTDWVQFYLNLPSRYQAGIDTHYCTGNPVVLGRIVSLAAGTDLPSFAQANLFGPMGIAHAVWNRYDDGRQTDSGGHLRLRPRDLAKIGLLVLGGGKWNGQQLVSSDWIARSTTQVTSFDASPRDGYAYLWWRSVEPFRNVEMFYANGNGGQYLFVVPQADLVVVFTGENYDSQKQDLPFSLLDQFILPALR
jgi:CubicO group peptidase (beta-lactamase class C family)